MPKASEQAGAVLPDGVQFQGFGAGLEAAAPARQTEQTKPAGQQHKPLSFPYRFSRRNHLLLLYEQGKYVLVYEKTLPLAVLCEVQRSLGFIPKLRHEDNAEAFDDLLQTHYAALNQSEVADNLSDEILDLETAVAILDEPDDLLNSQDEAPIIRLLNAIFFEAIRSKASDIHMQPREQALEVRFRLDGVLHTKLEQPARITPLMVSRIKVLARLDIAEKRLPQDGRIAVKIGGRNIDMRISTLPSAFGERVVMRLLDKNQRASRLGELGIDDRVLAAIRESINRPHGIVLVTGPTGSGKTTTLYGALTELDKYRLNIMTIEDPIEYYFDGISQTQINKRADMTFARGLRAILRQDPDVVMIGEIRDFETAEIAIQASLTGHLMLSTLHTNTAVGAITRLVDMGLPAFLLASTVSAVLSQRLVRCLCHNCRKQVVPNGKDKLLLASTLKRLHIVDGKFTIYQANTEGCDTCFHTGYQGRTGIYEVLQIDDELRQNIHTGATESTMTRHARQVQKMESLRENGFAKVLKGITSMAEVLRVTQE